MKNSIPKTINNAEMLHVRESYYICNRNFSIKQTHTQMKKKITALLAGIFALIISSNAQNAPTVTYTATPASVCAGGAVTFTNTAINFPTLWTWSFPGGNPSTYTTTTIGNPPPITYNYPGSYNVTCIVSNGTPPNDTVTTQNCVIVLPVPKAIIVPAVAGICTPNQDSVYLTVDTAGGGFAGFPYTYTWNPGGLTCSNCSHPQTSPLVSTDYTLVVTGRDGCSVTDNVMVNVGALVASITGRDTICAGLSDTLFAGGGSQNPPGTTYRWSNAATTSSIIITPSTTTTYSVFISSDGCTASSTLFQVYVSPKPNFAITYIPADSICLGQRVGINLSPNMYGPPPNNYQYIWYGISMAPDTTANFRAQPIITTTYTLEVRTVGGCHIDSAVKIKVNKPPHITFTGATDLCQYSTTTITASGGPPGERYVYHWFNNDTTPSINVEGIVSFDYTLTVSSGACSEDTGFSIQVDSMPHIRFKGDTSICIGDSTTIYVLPSKHYTAFGYTYLWNTGSTIDSVNTGKLIAGETLSVKVTKGACSLDDTVVQIKVYPPPNPYAVPANITICQWDSVKLTAAGGDYYVWTPGPKPSSGLNHYYYIGDTDINNASPATTTQYYVDVCSWGCCKKDSVTVNVTPGVLGFNVCCNDTVSSGTPVNLSATFTPGPYEVQSWSPATGLSCENCANPTATVNNTTQYVVTFLDLLTSCTVKDSVTITIFNCNVFVPNVFSPNGDGVNDYLYVRSLCMKSMDFAVYDRYGNKVFETESVDVPWDGTYHGKPSGVGTYMWYLTGVLDDGTHVSRSGNVTLIR